MKNACRVVLFLVLRLEWHLACQTLTIMGRARQRGIWIPGFVFNVVGAVMGTSWAFRGMRLLGWEPRFD